MGEDLVGGWKTRLRLPHWGGPGATGSLSPGWHAVNPLGILIRADGHMGAALHIPCGRSGTLHLAPSFIPGHF